MPNYSKTEIKQKKWKEIKADIALHVYDAINKLKQTYALLRNFKASINKLIHDICWPGLCLSGGPQWLGGIESCDRYDMVLILSLYHEP